MNRQILQDHLNRPQTRLEIIQEFCRDKEVLDVGCVHHDIENADMGSWLHKTVVEVAAYALGVDYLEDAVAALVQRGYNVVVGDVNTPLTIDRKFDVIVVGNLIEHLTNFEGLMKNLNQLLKPDGVALVSTANPFFREQYFYSAFKNDIIVNPEHTCWLDPVTLDQLCRRFGLETTEVRWVKEKWWLSEAIFNGEKQTIDTYTGHWTFYYPPSLLERFLTPGLMLAFRLLLPHERQVRVKRRDGNELGRFLYLRFKGIFVEIYWRLHRSIVPTSDINRHELFMSVLRRCDFLHP